MTFAVPCRSRVKVSFTGPLTHRCPYFDEVDRGTVTISWETAGATFELHKLTDWLEEFGDDELSHEDVTEAIRSVLAGFAGITNVDVITRWTTAGEVTVSAVSS